MRILAGVAAIGAMGVLAYVAVLTLPLILPIPEVAPIWAVVVTLLAAPWALHSWQPEEEGGTRAHEWIQVFGWGWAISIVSFVFAGWLHDVPLPDTLSFPPALWDDRESRWHDLPFWLAMLCGPANTLLVSGSLVRLAVLRLLGIPPMTAADEYRRNQKFYRWQDWSGWFSLLVMPLLAFIVGSGGWILYEALGTDRFTGLVYLAVWAPVSLLLLLFLHKVELVRFGYSLGVTVLLLILLRWSPFFRGGY